MKKFFIFIICLMAAMCFTSCNSNNEESKIKSTLKDVVIEHGMGLIQEKDYKFVSLEIDTVRCSDIKEYVESKFPKKHYPEGIPTDFENENFYKFIKPSLDKDDNSVIYLSVKHKYNLNNPIVNRMVPVTTYVLIDPVTFEYVGEDLRKDESFDAVEMYEVNKAYNYEMKKIEKEIEEYI